MARSGTVDTVENFRFDVQIISVSLSPGNLINNFTQGGLTQFARAGFSRVGTPEFTNNVMQYRENTDNYLNRKIPGLQSFNNISLERGVVALPNGQSEINRDNSKDFYRWLTQVNSANPALSLLTEVTNADRNALLRQSENYRKDAIIILRDRAGRATRRWYILNAFPVNYKGSTDLDAQTEEKAIENLTLAYELAFELPSLVDAATEFIADLTGSPVADVASDLNLDF